MRNWRERFRVDPVLTGTIIGFLIAGIVYLSAAALALGFYLVDLLHPMGGGTGLGLITGFVIGPIVLLAGFPWSLMVLDFLNSHHIKEPIFAILGIAIGVLINGSIIGCIVGMNAELRD